MGYIYITVKTAGKGVMDLKIPDYVTGNEFLDMLSEITGKRLPAQTRIQAEPVGRILDNAQTFASEGVETGALLTFI